MQWKCSHCGLNVTAPDEHLNSGWSFSQCLQCRGFALVKKNERHTIKVDRAPSWEAVIQANPAPAEPHPEAPKPLGSKPVARPLTQSKTITTPQAVLKRHKIPHLLPDLPEEPSSAHRKAVAATISLAAVGTVCFGIYLYIQGQAFWEKSRSQGKINSNASLPPHTETSSQAETEVIPPPSLASQVTAHDPRESHPQKDQLHQNAMAPLRAPENAGKVPQVIAKALSHAQIAALIIKPITENAELHSGPGQIYPKIGTASSDRSYSVTDWSNQWFKILLPEAKTAWIKTEDIQVVSEPNL